MKRLMPMVWAVAALLFINACVVVDDDRSRWGGGGGGGGWQELGRVQADFRNDRDTIQVGRGEGPFRALQLVVDGGDVEIHDMVVIFGNGERFEPRIRHRFNSQSRPAVIDLPGDTRNIRRIEFNYRSTDRREGRALVSVYGR